MEECKAKVDEKGKTEEERERPPGDEPVNRKPNLSGAKKNANKRRVVPKEKSHSKSFKSPFSNTRKKITAFRRGVKKFWDVWSGFTRTSAPEEISKKKTDPQTLGVPGFEEIACIDVDMPDLMTTDKDKIRSSCKQCLKDPPKFPTKEQVKSKLIAADKYYGVNRSKHSSNQIMESESLEHDADYFDEDGKIIRPSWRFILERPLVEQYVLMTNYIRKISVLAELEGTHNDKYIEEVDSGSDTEYEKFTEKHKSEMRHFVESMREPAVRETGVQTSAKTSQVVEEHTSETSLYPDSGSSNESLVSKRESAVTIITSRELSTPLQSDFETKPAAGTRVKNAVRWWESKDPPPTSESFHTSCDSVRETKFDQRSTFAYNEHIDDTSGSGSDGRSVPVHNAAAKISLVELDRLGKHQEAGTEMESIERNPISLEKGTTTQKRVSFAPVVKYFNQPQKTSGVFSIPTQFITENFESRAPVSSTALGSNIHTLTSNQEQIVLHLGTPLKDRASGFTISQNELPNEMQEATSIKSQKAENEGNNILSQNLPKTNTNGKTKPMKESIYPSIYPDITQMISSDYLSSPEPMSDQSSKREQSDKESKESSSNSSERIELRHSPAVIFKPGDAITNLATDQFYPEVPNMDDSKDEWCRGVINRGLREVLPFTRPQRRIEGPGLAPPAKTDTLIKRIIVRTPDGEREGNLKRALPNAVLNEKYSVISVEAGGRKEPVCSQRLEYKRENSPQKVEIPQQTTGYQTLLEDLDRIRSQKNPMENAVEKVTDIEAQDGGLLGSNRPRAGYREIQRKSQAALEIQFSKPTNEGITTRPLMNLPNEGGPRSLKREAPAVDVRENDGDVVQTKKTENFMKGPPRANNIITPISSEIHHTLREIPEEHEYSVTEVTGMKDVINEGHIKSQLGQLSKTKSYEDFGKFDVLRTSQIYSSSSSFVTPSEERLGFGLSKVEATIFQPMVVDDIIPQVNFMPSKTENSSSFNRITTPSNSTAEEIMVDRQVIREIHEIHHQPQEKIRKPEQFEILVPSYVVVGNFQYSTQEDVNIETEEARSTTLWQMDEENIQIAKSNIETVLKKVHETVTRQNMAETRSERLRKQWLMDVIPTVIKTSTKTSKTVETRQQTKFGVREDKTTAAETKPVFKFLKRQKEMESHEE